ncbi:b41bd2fe-4d16-4b57-a4e2-b80fad95291b [Thermothielavioides terrestris]|uniref:B41bd2fe-4d16-4b57-a4e2-b80fad95291b n=1 Tax=Thermothielavioides terrestris TaxID=2587410 RepID=A0A3S4B2J4_9PEZI|nr:b41bd2fe-4d16-4b57-a4e2-b80fad95291b [Thermothielavioides terrestris]
MRPSSYEEDVHLRRLYEQRDEHLARKMHSLDAFGHHGSHADFDHRNRRDYELHEDVPGPRDRRRRAEPRSYGASFGEDDYHRRAATVVAPSPPQAHLPPAPPPPRSAFEPPLSRPAFDRSEPGFDYVSAAQRLRGMRYASPERFDDYPAESYPPERRRDRSPSQWHPFTPERRPRSRDRRHTFPSESRPTSPETWQQLPTRYPSPERPMPAPEERRRVHSAERLRAPSSDRRRATSLERRLADRFKAESRQSPVAPTSPVAAVGPAGPFGPAGTLGPLSPTRAPPPVTRAATHIGVGMPMAPVPPPAVHGPVPVVTHLRRHHTMDEDVYAPGGMHGGAIPPTTGSVLRPLPTLIRILTLTLSKLEEPKSSVLAGLAGVGRGMHRVSEWVHYVEPGLPEGEQTPTVVQ